jgi:hypothetical protein
MYTYDVISESVRNPHQLASELTRRSQEGWEVVQITFDGASWFHAFIRHSGYVSVAPHPGMTPDQLKEIKLLEKENQQLKELLIQKELEGKLKDDIIKKSM